MSSRRSQQWHLVGRPSDPVPADEQDVRLVAKDFTTRATVMEEAATTLDQLAGLDGWTGNAAKKFAEKAAEAHGDLGKAAEKYADAGAALSTYAGEVAVAREATLKAVQAAETADQDRLANQGDQLDGIDEPTDDQKDAQEQREKDHAAATEALGQARKDLDLAMEALGTAASNAAARINKASEKFKDSRMDNIKGFIAAAVDVLNVIAIVILAVVVVVLVVATLGGFLAVVAGFVSVMLTISTIVGALIFVLTAVQLSMGEATWGDLAWASLAVLGPGLGKLGSLAARPALARLASVARLSAEASARGSLSYRLAGFAQRIPIRSLRNHLDDFRTGLVDDAVAGVDNALATIPKAGSWAQVAGMDSALDLLRNRSALANLADQAPADLARLRRIATLQGAGGVGGLTGNAHDIWGIPDSFGNTFDTLTHLPEVFTFDAPKRPTTVVEVGR